MTLALTKDELRRAAGGDAEARAKTARKVGATFSAATLSEAERAAAIDIFRVLARDAEILVRTALAEAIRSAPHIPHDLAMGMARDVEQVAVPLLRFSPAFTEEDLIEIVRSGVGAKQVAISQRDALPAAVAGAIVEAGSVEAVTALLGNPSVSLTEGRLMRVMDRHGTASAVQQELAQRPRLPMAVAERLVSLAADAMRAYVALRHELPPDLATDLILDASERALMRLSLAGSPEDVATLVERLLIHERLSESLIIRALCAGDLDFCTHSLARIAAIPVARAQDLLRTSEGLSLLSKRCGLSAEFARIAAVAMHARDDLQMGDTPDSYRAFGARVIERVLTHFENDDRAGLHADYLLRRLTTVTNRNPPGLSAPAESA